jgi:transposase
VVSTVADPTAFRSGRNFSAWIGLVPNQPSSGGKNRLDGIRKLGDRYLRGLFVAGALAVNGLGKGPRHQTSALARGLAGAAADQGCGYRAG